MSRKLQVGRIKILSSRQPHNEIATFNNIFRDV